MSSEQQIQVNPITDVNSLPNIPEIIQPSQIPSTDENRTFVVPTTPDNTNTQVSLDINDGTDLNADATNQGESGDTLPKQKISDELPNQTPMVETQPLPQTFATTDNNSLFDDNLSARLPSNSTNSQSFTVPIDDSDDLLNPQQHPKPITQNLNSTAASSEDNLFESDSNDNDTFGGNTENPATTAVNKNQRKWSLPQYQQPFTSSRDDFHVPASHQPPTNIRPPQNYPISNPGFGGRGEYNSQPYSWYNPYNYPYNYQNQPPQFGPSGRGMPPQNFSYNNPQPNVLFQVNYIPTESEINLPPTYNSYPQYQQFNTQPQYYPPQPTNTRRIISLEVEEAEETIATPTYVEYQTPKSNEKTGQIKIHFSSTEAAAPVVSQIERKQILSPCEISLTNQDSTIVLHFKNRKFADFNNTGAKSGTFFVEDQKTRKLMPCLKFKDDGQYGPQQFFEGIFGKKFDGQNFLSDMGNNNYAFTEKFFVHYAKPMPHLDLPLKVEEPINKEKPSSFNFNFAIPVVREPRKTAAAPAAKPITPPYVEFKAPTAKTAGSIEVTFKPEDMTAVITQFNQLKESNVCSISRKNNTFFLSIKNSSIEIVKNAGTGVMVEKAKTPEDAPKVAAMFKFMTKEGRDAFLKLFGMEIDNNLVKKPNDQNKNIVMVTPEFFAEQKAKKEEAERKTTVVLPVEVKTREVVLVETVPEKKKEEEKEIFSFPSFSSFFSKPKTPLSSYAVKPTNMKYKPSTVKEAGHIEVTFKPEDMSAVITQFNQLKERNVCQIFRKNNTFILTITNNNIGLVGKDKIGVGTTTKEVNGENVLMPAFKFATEAGCDAFLKLFDLNIDNNLITVFDRDDKSTSVAINPEFFSNYAVKKPEEEQVDEILLNNNT